MTTTPTLGPEVTFSIDIFAGAPRVTALADGTFTISWESGLDIFGRHFSALGSLIGGDFLSALTAADPKDLGAPIVVQQTDGSVIVEYSQLFGAGDGDIRWHLVAPDFSPGTNSFGTEVSGFDEFLSDATATASGGSAIAYETPAPGPGPESLTVLRFVSPVGLPASNQIFVGPHLPGESQFHAQVAGIFNGNVAVVYENFNFATLERDIRMHVFTPLEQEAADGDGNSGPDDGEVDVSGLGRNAAFPDLVVTNGGTPDIAIDGQIVVVWQDITGIAFKRFTDELAIPMTATEPTTITGSAGILPQIAALDDGGFIIVWSQAFGTEGDGTADFDVAIQRFDINGNAVGDRVFIDNPGDQFASSLTTLADGRVIVTLSNETGDATNLTTLDYRIIDPRDAIINGTAANNTIVGRDDGSSIFGLAGNDSLFGSAVNDTLDGGIGADMMAGFLGNDIYFVDDPGDVVDEGGVGSGGTDTVRSFINFSLADTTHVLGDLENLRLLGTALNGTGNGLANSLTGNDGDNLLVGGDGDDKLRGGDGKDILKGEEGNDLLVGGADRDIMFGGLGKDKFDFDLLTDSARGVAVHDIIRAFSHAEHDKIDLLDIDAKTHVAGNQAFHLIGNAAFSHTEGELRFTNGLVRGDVNGNGVADFAIKVFGLGAAVNGDFVL